MISVTDPEPSAAAPRPELRHVVVVGFGLIGASVGRALLGRGVKVSGVDVGPAIGRAAAREAATEVLDVDGWQSVRGRAREACLVLLATPVRTIEALLPGLLEDAEAVLDCGSTKRSVMAVAAQSPYAERFVGGHPMAGRPRGGVDSATAELFVGRPWILCTEGAGVVAVGRAQALIELVGAREVQMSAAAHDRAVARTSHLTQILSSLLRVMAAEPEVRAAAGPAFERTTRAAGGAEAMWRDILDSNADEVAAALREVAARAGAIADGLGREPADLTEALALLGEARALRAEDGE